MLNAIVMLASLWTGFLNPPDSAKPWCYYWWINGHVDEKTITADLESMRGLGFGGILLFDSRGYWDDSDDFVVNPKAELEWGSPRWYDLVEHALRECARLKLEFTMNASASGGEFNGFTNGVKYVTDVSDAKAVAAHLDRVVGPLLKRCPDLVGRTFTHIYSISYEGKLRKGATWSAVRESFYGTMRNWAHRHGIKVYSESGGPWPSDVAAALGDADQLSILACNDVPQGEFWPQWQNGFSPLSRHANVGARYFTRGPVLAARQAGLPVVSAEAFTHMQRHWSVDPAFLKPLADQAFADGINRIVWHTFTASPERFGVPGAEYFAGSHVNRNVTWHREAGPFVRYLGRCSYLLRQGEYVDDGEFAEASTNYYGWGRHRRDPKAQFTAIHRRTKEGDLFFVAGEGAGAVDFNASGPAEIWDAVEGSRKPVRGKAVGAGRTRIDLNLPVGGSCFVVFGRTDGRLPEPTGNPPVKTRVNGPWQVEFSYHPGIAASPPAPVVLNELVDFTAREDLKHFAGKATYRATFAFDGRPSGEVRLSLGKVLSGLAHVWLNGVDCGTVWCEPWECDVGKAVREGTNELRIDYYNNWYNRLVGDCQLPAGKRVTRSTVHYWATPRTGDHMRVSGRKPTLCSGYSATDPLQPSGVLGPIEVAAAFAAGSAAGERRLALADYRDKMEGGWVAQMAGVEWGTPTEFKWVHRTVPADKVPAWKPEMINGAFGNDDLYVEMTFLRTLARDGIDPDIRAAGIDFANSKYDLWCANLNGRINLRAGIAPPDSSHPAYHASPDDIDYQIEADYAGLICPGLPRRVQKLGDVFGRLMNYGDGLYAGVFVGGMYATAFFTEDRLEILEGGLACIPAESRYAKTIRDVIAWWRENPNDWEYAWRKLDAKHGPGAGKFVTTAGIDAALNGASAVIGLLYGNGDLAKTIVIAMRCGYDSDCNPSTAAGVLGTSMGLKRIPETFRSGLKRSTKFNHSDFDFDSMTATCEALARKIVAAEGGRIERDADGNERFVIPEQKPEARPYVSAAHPGPVAHSAYTDEELARIAGARRLPEPSAFDDTNATRRVQNALDALWPGWTITTEMRADWRAPMGGGAESCGYFRSAWWTGEKTSQKLGAYLRMRAPKDRPFIALANRSCSVGTMMPAMRMAFCTGWGRETPFELRLDGETAFRGTFSMQTRTFTVPLDRWAGKTVFAELLFWPSNGVPVCLMSPIELLTTGK